MKYIDFHFRQLASGCYLIDLHYTYRIGKSCQCNSQSRTIWICLRRQCLPRPTEDTWKEIANGFLKTENFPNCLGAIDRKHVRVVKPIKSGSLYYNYKEFFSIVLLAVADSDYKFVFVDIRSFGKDSDSTIFKKSLLWKSLNDNTLIQILLLYQRAMTSLLRMYLQVMIRLVYRNMSQDLTRVKCCHLKNSITVCRWLVGTYLECSFGILRNKWRVFH